MNSEYVRNLNRNFMRIILEEDADCKRYQFCILFRGGIKYLLECDARQIDGSKYLYYDISSSQNLRQMFARKNISRQWMQEFFWSLGRLRQELNRFLLDENNIIWNPECIFQDLEKNDFMFVYKPYHKEAEESEGFGALLEFWVDKIDYDDMGLVEFVYHAYDQYKVLGACYLESRMAEDLKHCLEAKKSPEIIQPTPQENEAQSMEENLSDIQNKTSFTQEPERRGIMSFFGRNKRKSNEDVLYQEVLQRGVKELVVCEELSYGTSANGEDSTEEFGKTIYIEEKEEKCHGLYTTKGELVIEFEKFPFLVGKRKEDVDYVLADYSASRVHARFLSQEDGLYIEDLNSTNGTFKNGLRMQPYEKRKLEAEDEIRLGKSVFIYK